MTAAALSEACRLYILAVLLASAAGKARALGRFAESLEVLVRLSPRWSKLAAAAVTGAELLVALALLVGGAVAQLGMAAALVMLLAFTAVLLVALVQRQEVSCNCFGAGEHPISGWDVARNGLLISACVVRLLLGPPGNALPPSTLLLLLGAAGVAFLISTNLRRIASVLGWMPRPELAGPPPTLPIGQAVPPFEGRALADGRPMSSTELAGQAAVVLFLSSGCPKCREKIPVLQEILPSIRSAGIGLWIVPADSRHDISPLLEGSALLEHVVLLEPAVRDRLNPRRAAPFYLFIDHQMAAVASGQIGDGDWLSFVEQMKESAASSDTVA